MKIIIVSYSRTGRNHALATSLALELSIEHIKISEEKNRTNYCSSGQAAIPPERSPCLSSCPPSSSVQGVLAGAAGLQGAHGVGLRPYWKPDRGDPHAREPHWRCGSDLIPLGIEGVPLVTWYLVLAAALWVVVAAVAVSKGGKLTRHPLG